AGVVGGGAWVAGDGLGVGGGGGWVAGVEVGAAGVRPPLRRGSSGRRREPASRAPVVCSDIVDPPSRGGLRGAEEAVLERGGELPQGGHRGVGLLQQCGGGAVGRLPVQRAQQVARIPAVDAGAQRDQRGAQLGGGCHVRQPVQGQAQPLQLERDRARQGGVGQQQLQQQLGLDRGVVGAPVGGAALRDQ